MTPTDPASKYRSDTLRQVVPALVYFHTPPPMSPK
jgi:hypothetical protein